MEIGTHFRRGAPVVAVFAIMAFGAARPTARAQELTPVRSSLDRPLFDSPIAHWGRNTQTGSSFRSATFSWTAMRRYFKHRQQLPAGSFGGIESFHYETPVGTNDLLTIDGRGIFDTTTTWLRSATPRTRWATSKPGIASTGPTTT